PNLKNYHHFDLIKFTEIKIHIKLVCVGRELTLEYNNYTMLCTRSTSTKPEEHRYFIEDKQIEAVTELKHLGVYVDSRLSWDQHIDNIATRAMRLVKFTGRALRGAPPATREATYRVMVRPTLEYASV